MTGLTVLTRQNEPISVVVQTQGSPVWLTLTTMGVSLLAIAISVFQAINGYKERKSKLPKIGASLGFFEHVGADGGPAFTLGIQNRSAVATNILGWLIAGEAGRTSWMLNGQNMLDSGSGPIPGRVDAYSSNSYWIKAGEMQAAAEVVTMSINLGHGENIRLEVKRGGGFVFYRGQRAMFGKRLKRQYQILRGRFKLAIR